MIRITMTNRALENETFDEMARRGKESGEHRIVIPASGGGTCPMCGQPLRGDLATRVRALRKAYNLLPQDVVDQIGRAHV